MHGLIRLRVPLDRKRSMRRGHGCPSCERYRQRHGNKGEQTCEYLEPEPYAGRDTHGTGHRCTDAQRVIGLARNARPDIRCCSVHVDELARQDRRELGEPATFVVDVDGALRLAPRRSEHVALAGGQDVLAAGEMRFVVNDDGWRVAEVTNQSTGYCPDPDSWPAVATALDREGIRHPGDFTAKIVFRRCPGCGERNIVRDDDFTCALCGNDLPPQWNFT
jgi:hypothetical protein